MDESESHTYTVSVQCADELRRVSVNAENADEAVDLAITTVLANALTRGLDVLPEELEAIQVQQSDD